VDFEDQPDLRQPDHIDQADGRGDGHRATQDAVARDQHDIEDDIDHQRSGSVRQADLCPPAHGNHVSHGACGTVDELSETEDNQAGQSFPVAFSPKGQNLPAKRNQNQQGREAQGQHPFGHDFEQLLELFPGLLVKKLRDHRAKDGVEGVQDQEEQ